MMSIQQMETLYYGELRGGSAKRGGEFEVRTMEVGQQISLVTRLASWPLRKPLLPS